MFFGKKMRPGDGRMRGRVQLEISFKSLHTRVAISLVVFFKK